MNRRNQLSREDSRSLTLAALGTFLAGVSAVAMVSVVHAGDPPGGAETAYLAAAAAAVRSDDGWDPAALAAEAVEGRINAATPDEDSELAQGGPVITMIDLGDPAFGETAGFGLTLASDGGAHQCEFYFLNGRGEEIRVAHQAWQVSLEQGRTRLNWRLQKTFHLTQFPPTADNRNQFVLECDGRISDRVEFQMVVPR